MPRLLRCGKAYDQNGPAVAGRELKAAPGTYAAGFARLTDQVRAVDTLDRKLFFIMRKKMPHMLQYVVNCSLLLTGLPLGARGHGALGHSARLLLADELSGRAGT